MDLSFWLDPGINVAAQSLPPVIAGVLASGHDLDTMPVYLAVMVIVYLGLHPRYGICLVTLFGITDGINEALKLAFHLPRPYWLSSAVKAYALHSSFGFPSGGAMCSTVLYGWIIAVIRRWWVMVACAVLIVWTVLARIFAGVHFLLDVIGGLLFGLLILAIFLAAQPRIETWIRELSPSKQFAGILVVSSVPLLVTVPAYLSLADWQLPASWAATALIQSGEAMNPARIQYAWTATGLLLGSLLGYEFLLRKGGWTPPAGFLQRIFVVSAGIVSVLAIFTLQNALESYSNFIPFPAQLASLAGMALTSFWFAGGIPLLARAAGLGTGGTLFRQ